MNSLKAETDFHSAIYFQIVSKGLAYSTYSINVCQIHLSESVKQFQTKVLSFQLCSKPARPETLE
jgi:hypothetical protein